jgi:hypothetical protein
MSAADRIEDLVAYLRKMEQEGCTGRMDMELQFNKGGISRVRVMREEPSMWPKATKGDGS